MTANVTFKSQPLAYRKKELLSLHQMVIKTLLCLLTDKYHFIHFKDVFINQTFDLNEAYTKWLIQKNK